MFWRTSSRHFFEPCVWLPILRLNTFYRQCSRTKFFPRISWSPLLQNYPFFYFIGSMKASFPVISGFEVVSDKVTASSKMQIPTVSSQRLLTRLFRISRRGCRSEAIYVKHILCIYTLYTTGVFSLTNLRFFGRRIKPFPPYIGLPVHFVYG